MRANLNDGDQHENVLELSVAKDGIGSRLAVCKVRIQRLLSGETGHIPVV